MAPASLSRFYKKYTGKSISNYLIGYPINQFINLLNIYNHETINEFEVISTFNENLKKKKSEKALSRQ